MGLDCSTIKFLAAAKSVGVDFHDIVTIGRQDLFPKRRSLKRVFSVHGIEDDPRQFLKSNPYGEALFHKLGAQRVDSVDSSSYEDATIVHDMNTPISAAQHQQYSVVYDGGSLEHIFNIPQALKNCMEMVRVGGHFMQASIANNFMGHGFWQFSPEVFFRAMSPVNGFQTEVVLLHEVGSRHWAVVQDPEVVRRRVELCNSRPTYLFAIAKRISDVPVFAETPQQGFYVSMWENGVADHAKPTARQDGHAARLHRSIRKRVSGIRQRLPKRQFASSYYQRLSEADLLAGRIPLRASGASPGSNATRKAQPATERDLREAA